MPRDAVRAPRLPSGNAAARLQKVFQTGKILQHQRRGHPLSGGVYAPDWVTPRGPALLAGEHRHCMAWPGGDRSDRSLARLPRPGRTQALVGAQPWGGGYCW